MELSEILEDLRAEREGLDEAIISLEQMADVQPGRRRGRPPVWLIEARENEGSKKKHGR